MASQKVFHHWSCQASSPSRAAQSASCLSTFAVEHLHNQPQTSQAGNDMSAAWKSSSTFLLLQPLFSLPWPIPVSRRQSKGAEGSWWEQTSPQAFTAERQFWTAGLAQGIQCAHEDPTGSPQQNYSPDCSRAAIYSLQSILLTLRATLTCRSQSAATCAAQLHRAGGLSSHSFVHCFTSPVLRYLTLGPDLKVSQMFLGTGATSSSSLSGARLLLPHNSQVRQQGAAVSLLQHMV